MGGRINTISLSQTSYLSRAAGTAAVGKKVRVPKRISTEILY